MHHNKVRNNFYVTKVFFSPIARPLTQYSCASCVLYKDSQARWGGGLLKLIPNFASLAMYPGMKL